MVTLEELERRAFWQGLCPSLAVTEDGFSLQDGPLDAPLMGALAVEKEALAAGLVQLQEEGYLQLPPILPAAEVAAMAEAVVAVTAACGSPVFALVYDAFWALPWRLSGVLTAILGGDVELLPDAWVWKIEPTSEDAGWSPHRDRDHGTIDADGTPQIISLWVPLTDATPANGCIYVLPASRDPDYARDNPEGRNTIQQLQHIRALPAEAGSVLCWTHQLLHWGGSSSRFAVQPRISVAFEVQRRGLAAFSTPLLPIDEVPAFAARLGFIGRMLLQYQKMHPLSGPLQKLAKQLRRHMPGKRSFADILGRLRGKS